MIVLFQKGCKKPEHKYNYLHLHTDVIAQIVIHLIKYFLGFYLLNVNILCAYLMYCVLIQNVTLNLGKQDTYLLCKEIIFTFNLY